VPTKALKTKAHATPHTATQPLPLVDKVAEAAKLQEAMARGSLESQLARARESGGDTGQSGAAEATRAEAVDEAGRGGVERAAQPEVEAGRGGADAAAQPEVGTGEGEAGNAAQPETGGAGAGGGAQERPTSQREGETLILEPAGAEGVTEEESALRAPAVEETHVPEPARAGDKGAAAAAMEQAMPASMVPVVELPPSSDECGDSGDIDPAAAASAADKFAEFMSASEEVLNAGTSEGPRHGAIIQSGVPSEFLSNEREEEAV